MSANSVLTIQGFINLSLKTLLKLTKRAFLILEPYLVYLRHNGEIIRADVQVEVCQTKDIFLNYNI